MKSKFSHRALSVLLIFCFVIMSVSAVFVVDAGAEANIDEGLTGYWNFDQDDGQTVKNQAGDSFDGTLSGSGISVQSVGTLSGGMLHMTGDASSKMTVSSAINSSENFSISFWLNLDSTINNGRNENVNIIQQSGNGRTLIFYSVSGAESPLSFATFMSGANVFSSGGPTPGSWDHVVMTSDASTHNVKLYLNGEVIMNSTIASDCSETTDLIIGTHKNNSGPVKGDIDEVRLYSRVISEEDVAALYDLGGSVAKLQQLRAKIAEAEALQAQNLLDEESEQAKNLAAQIEAAGKVVENTDASEDDIKAAVDTLQAAMDAYKAAVGNLPITVTVDPDNVINTLSDAFYGANHRYYDNALGTWDPETGKILEQFDGYMKDASFGSVRYPGGTVGNLVKWKETIGENRVNQPHGFYFWNNTVEPNFGVDEAASYIIDELGSEMIYMYGIGRGSAKDAADLVEYLNAEVGEDPNHDGVDWAKVRSDNGHPEPYGVKYFEIGNEPETDGYQQYWLNGRKSGRSLQDAYLYGSYDKEGNYSEDNAFTFDVNTDYATFGTTYVADNGNWASDFSDRYSNGEANQVKYIRFAPIVPESETITVGGEVWNRVESLETADADDKVYTIDNESGKICFGDGEHGSIPAQGAEIRAGYTKLADGFVNYYDAMKAVDPDIKVYASIHSNGFVDLLYNNNEDRFDGLVYHRYTGGFTGTEDLYERFMEREESVIANDIGNLEKYLASKGYEDKKLAISEYGIYNVNHPLLTTQTSALYNAKALFTMSKMTSIDYTNRHCVVDFPEGDTLGPGRQAVIQSYKTGDTVSFVSTPSARMFEMLANMTGNIVISDSMNRNIDFYNNVKALSTLSTKDSDGNIYLAILNLDKTENHDVVYHVNGVDFTDKKLEAWTLAGDSYDAENTLENPDAVDIKISEITSDSENLELSVPAHGIVMIKVEADSSVTPGPNPSDNKIGDVDGSGDIGTGDVTLVLQYIAGIVHEGDEGYDHSVSDVTGDEVTDTQDVTAILQYIATIITKFPVEE